jgi:hypothetical protein
MSRAGMWVGYRGLVDGLGQGKEGWPVSNSDRGEVMQHCLVTRKWGNGPCKVSTGREE